MQILRSSCKKKKNNILGEDMEITELVKQAQMDLLAELDRICKKWDIPYFLTAGTLIGAVRHDGFIPWDDDLDVGLLRKYCDRLEEACAKDLDPAYYLHCWKNDPNSPNCFYKLKIKGTHYPEQIAASSKMDDGIFIDIFPFDNAPDSARLRKRHHRKRVLLQKMLLLRARFDLGGDSKAKRLIYAFMKPVAFMRSLDSWKKSFLKLQNKYNHLQTEEAVNLCGAYSYYRESQSKTVLENLTTHNFEGIPYSIPADYDTFLRRQYGNYMQLPPEDQRVGRHFVTGIDFGNYKIRYKAPK